MILSKIFNKLNEGMINSGYSRAAKELSILSDRQLADIGISRELLKKGGNAYPWREEDQSALKVAPANLSIIDTNSVYKDAPMRPQTPKAA